MLNEKVMKWRQSPLHRKCKYCKWLHYYPINGFFYCQAKAKVISDCLPDMTEMPRLFCKLYEVKELNI